MFYFWPEDVFATVFMQRGDLPSPLLPIEFYFENAARFALAVFIIIKE